MTAATSHTTSLKDEVILDVETVNIRNSFGMDRANAEQLLVGISNGKGVNINTPKGPVVIPFHAITVASIREKKKDE